MQTSAWSLTPLVWSVSTASGEKAEGHGGSANDLPSHPLKQKFRGGRIVVLYQKGISRHGSMVANFGDEAVLVCERKHAHLQHERSVQHFAEHFAAHNEDAQHDAGGTGNMSGKLGYSSLAPRSRGPFPHTNNVF